MSIKTTLDTITDRTLAGMSLTDLFGAYDFAKVLADEAATRKRSSDARVAEIKEAITARMKADGQTGAKDAATGISARIEERREWRVTDRDAATLYARSISEWNLLTVDAAAVIDYQKESGETIPGIEQITTERLVVTPPKGEK